MANKRERILAIVNPISGRRDMTATVEDIRQHLRAHDAALTVRTTTHAGDASRLAHQAPADADAILIVGGDGTVSEVVNGLEGRRTPLAILPTGTENIVARSLCMPADPAGTARTLLAGRPVDFDVGVANDRRFLAVTGVGFDADVVQNLVQKRRGHISYATYAGPILKTLFTHRWPRLVIRADGEVMFDDRGFVLIGNLARYSLNLRILARASFCDGLLDVCAFPCRSMLRLVGHAFDVVNGRHVDRAGIVYRQCHAVTVESSDPAAIETDGEPCGHLPLQCTVLPARTMFLIDPKVRLAGLTDGA